MKINRLFFTQGFVGQQIDLKKYSTPYWQPMKRTKQWNTASKWRRFCHQAGQLILYTPKPREVDVSNTIQKWITIIETTGHESSSKQFSTIQIKVMTNAPQIPHMVKAWVTDYRNMWAEGEICYQILHRDYKQIQTWVPSKCSCTNKIKGCFLSEIHWYTAYCIGSFMTPLSRLFECWRFSMEWCTSTCYTWHHHEWSLYYNLIHTHNGRSLAT